MSIQSWNILLVIALLIVLSGGGYILLQNHEQKQAEIEQVKAEEEARLAEEAQRNAEEQKALLQSFEDFLNTFLGDIYAEVQEYKQARKVMEELRKPSNLTSPEYVAENTSMAESTLMSLQLQMDDIMARFEKAGTELQPLIEHLNEDGQAHVREIWNAVRKENAEKFMAFFASDQEALRAELKLMEFYNDYADILHADAENERILFDDIALQEQEALLRAAIIEAKAVQKDLIEELSEAEEETE
ncbi:MAG: hypothetical protein H6861_01300 [Rhodospirillales bacterium]|nr:hypothetical protein [Rhodospirillales bacterium]